LSTKPLSRDLPATPTAAVVLAEVMTLADVIAAIQGQHDLPRQRRHDLVSAVHKVACLLGHQPGDIAADAATLRQRLLPFTAAGAGLSPGRWRNVRSLLSAALKLSGCTVARRRSPHSLSSDWTELLGRIPDRYERSRLSRLAGYCSAAAITAAQVDDAVVDAFGASLLASFIERPKQVHREACLTWNRCAAGVPGWPATRLHVPQHRHDYALPLTAYPDSFGADVAGYLDHLAGHNPFAETARQPASPLTLRDTRLRLLQVAAALVLSGHDPAMLRSLADLVTIDATRAALEFFWKRAGKRKTARLNQFAFLLIKLAKHWVKVPPEQLEALRQLRRQVDPGQTGMTERNRARLRQFDDPVNVRRLINLPQAIVHRLPRNDAPGYNDAVRVQSALAIAITLVAPMRVKNLAALCLDRHLVRARSGPGATTHLVIPGPQVKNKVDLEFQLPSDVRDLLDLYCARFRPLLTHDPSPFLFPARQGGAKPPAQLAAQVKRTIKQELGLVLNIHAFRHLCAKLFLESHPGEYETVRLLLGHKNLATTVRSYCGLEQGDALRRYDQLLDRYRTENGRRDVERQPAEPPRKERRRAA
jgi:integrase